MNNYISFITTNYPYIVIVFSFIIGKFFMPVVIDIAIKYNFVVSPNKRTSHHGDVPNVGGINIFVSFLTTVFLFSYNIFNDVQYSLLGLFIILTVGFIDDLIDIKAVWKLLGQIVAGFFLIVIADVRITSLQGFLGITELSTFVSIALSFFVYIVIVNAINLIDGIDGLASGLGVVYSLFFGIYFHLINKVNLSITSFALTGSLFVFFLYNVFSNKRKIFMGDSGSLLLGYMFFLFLIQFIELNIYPFVPEKYKMNAALVVGFTVLVVPLFDTLRVMLTRIKKGYSPFKADRNHIHHLMLKLGLKHRQVSYTIIIVSIIIILIALLGRNLSNEWLFLMIFAICLILTKILWVLVDKKANSLTEKSHNDKNKSNKKI